MNTEDLKIEQEQISISENELSRRRTQLISTLLEIETLLKEREKNLLVVTQNDRQDEVVWKEAA